MIRRVLWSIVVILVLTGLLKAAEEGELTFDQARELEKSGKLDEAFLAFLKIPGAEHLAARIARPKADHYLKLVRAHSQQLPPTAVQLLEGDLMLAGGEKTQALACYQAVASALMGDARQDRRTPVFAMKSYFVEPPVANPDAPAASYPTTPFSAGPGSHRDNWLIRRFIALDAMDAAAAEFARIWEIHRRNTRPYLVDMVVRFEDDKPVRERRLARRAGFDGRGLQFALDYAFFLKRGDILRQALEVLRGPLMAIDMDRNPNHMVYTAVGQDDAERYPLRTNVTPRHPYSYYFQQSAGVSRKEFIRLVYGVFKEAGEEDVLIKTIEKEIDSGENRLRRVLARIRFHQGRIDDALALELEYIKQANFNEISAARRRGQAYEDAGKLAEAAAAYEQVLALPYTPPRLPDADEEMAQSSVMRQVMAFAPDASMVVGQTRFQADMLRRLGRLYGALGKPDKAFEVSLRELEVNPALLQNLGTLGQAQARAEALGRQDQFRQWLRSQSDTADPLARANVYWLLEDYAGCGRALGEAWKGKSIAYSYDQWRDRVRRAGKEELRAFLVELLKADLQNARVRLDLLDLTDGFEGAKMIATLESLLETDASIAFARGKGLRNRTRFRNYFDLAYRLMRLYEKHGQDEKIVALGLRVLEGSKPFVRSSELTQLGTPRASWNGRSESEDLLDCLYVMLAHVIEPNDLQRIAALVDASSCIPLKNQLARLLPDRRGQRLDPSKMHRRPFGRVLIKTPGVPSDVLLLTHRDDVRSISPDGNWVGSSWGLVRYRSLEDDGLEIFQIPVGVRISTFCDTSAGWFVGTRGGLYRIDGPNDDEPSLTRIDLESVKRSSADGRDGAVSTEQMLWWRDALWVRDGDGLFRYEPAQQAARYYGRVPGRIFVADDTLWTGTHVLDPTTDEFKLIEAEQKSWHLIGATRDEIWADVYVDDQLRHRPALVDPKTHVVRVLPLEDATPGKKLLVNGPFEVFAEDAEHVWLLGNGSHLTIYDRATGTLRKVTRSPEGSAKTGTQHIGSAIWRPYQHFGHVYLFYRVWGAKREIPGLNLDGDRGPYFCWREMDGDRLLLGSGIVREWREDNLGYDDNSGMSHHIQDLEGGLFEIDTKTLKWQKLGSRAGELSDFYVKKIYFDDRDERAYVCTNGGVTILSLPGCDPIGRITVSDGLPSNKVEDVVRIGEKLYLACELGDEDGGLAVQDLNTGLIQRLSLADGLNSNKIKRLRAEGTKLHILYGTLYGPRAYNTPTEDGVQPKGGRGLTFRSSILDTQTGKLAAGDEVLPGPRPPDESNRLPFLGGAVLFDVTHSGKRFIGGTHGLVIVPADKNVAAGLPLRVEAVKPLLSLRQRQLAEAAKVSVPRAISLADLKRFLAHGNPFVKANALAAAMRPVREGDATYTPEIGKCVSDPCDRVRSTAVWLLAQAQDDGAVKPLKIAVRDRDRYIRGVAALGLARHGVIAPLTHFEEMLKYEDRYSNYPYGATSSVGVEVSDERVFAALAPHADRKVFELLLNYAISSDDYEPRQKIFVQLGAALRERPEAADLLLKAYTRPDDPGPDSNSGPARFAQEVFKHAGKDVLPLLHIALQSQDRVIRSNAARACGSIGDKSSIKPLIAALDLESGFSRGSIVWAVGELKAQEALPHLATLYVDARNDEKRRSGAGFRMSQVAAQVQSQFETIRNLDSISSDWDELKQSTGPAPVDPRRHEKLLSTQMVLEAVRKIGPSASQAFYRRLAGEADSEARREAAARMAEGTADDGARNIPILRNLLGDSDMQVRVTAAVSLLLLGERDVEKQIVTSLKSPEAWERNTALEQLLRVENGRSLFFARDVLQGLTRQVQGNDYAENRVRWLLERIGRG